MTAMTRSFAALALLLLTAAPGFSAPADYRFEVVPPVKVGADAAVVLRLIHVPSGKPVPDAVIFKTQLDMLMAGMAPMAAKAGLPKASGAGLYTLRAPLTMAGDWTLRLSAKVRGENETVTGAVTFTSVE
jgi:hypothetical protein